MARLKRGCRRIAAAIWRRVDRQSTVGLAWKRQGEFVTFEWEGFVAAPSIPLLFARHNYEMAVIERLVGADVERSLEFGCGFGRLTPTFAALSTHHTAIDINAEALAVARTTYPELEFIQSAGGRLPFEDDTFDLIATWTVLQHVPPHLIDATVDEINRVLSPGGRVLLCEETRNPGMPTRHSWHRPSGFYERCFEPLRLTYSSYIDELERLPESVAPGHVMLFEP